MRWMARMIPESPVETESAAERRLFERIRDETPDEVVAFHSVAWQLPDIQAPARAQPLHQRNQTHGSDPLPRSRSRAGSTSIELTDVSRREDCHSWRRRRPSRHGLHDDRSRWSTGRSGGGGLGTHQTTAPDPRVKAAEIMAAVREPTRRRPGRGEGEEWYFTDEALIGRWVQVVVHYEGGEGWIVTAFPRESPRMPRSL